MRSGFLLAEWGKQRYDMDLLFFLYGLQVLVVHGGHNLLLTDPSLPSSK